MARQGAAVGLSVGCECWLFAPGIVPGATVLERVKKIPEGNFDAGRMRLRLDRFIAKAAGAARSVFRGTLSYAAAQNDEVDWRLFDIVGVDYYSCFAQRADRVRELQRYRRWGKPVAITEFGTWAYGRR